MFYFQMAAKYPDQQTDSKSESFQVNCSVQISTFSYKRQIVQNLNLKIKPQMSMKLFQHLQL